MSVQIAAFAPATRVASRKLGPRAGSGSSSSAEGVAACETSTLASTCGRWRDAGEQPVVRARVDGRGARAQPAIRPMQALVQDPAAGARRQVPGGAVEQVRAGVLDARRLGAGDRMAAYEALVARRARRCRAWSTPRR